MFFNDWHDRLLFVITTFSLLIQAYVIFLVVKKSPTSMRTYRSYLISYTIWDLLFTITLGYVLNLDVKLPLMAGGYVNGLAQYWGPNGGILAVSAFAFFGAGLIYSMVTGLVFRYSAVQTDPRFMQYLMKPLTYVLSFAMAVLIAFTVGYSVYTATSKPQTYKADMPLPGFQQVLEDISHGQVVVNLNPFGWPAIRMSVTIIAGFVVSQLTAFFFGFFTIQTLNRNSRHFSKKTFRMHLQFTILVCVQIATPMIFIVFPLTVGVLLVFMGKAMDKFPAQIGIVLMSLYASTNSLLTIFFISPYRRHSKELLLKTFSKCTGKKANSRSSGQFASKVLKSVSHIYVSKNRKIYSSHSCISYLN